MAAQATGVRRVRSDITAPVASAAHSGANTRRSLRRKRGEVLPGTRASVRPAKPAVARIASVPATPSTVSRRRRERRDRQSGDRSRRDREEPGDRVTGGR